MVAPANDNVANAQLLLTGTSQVTGDTTDATSQAGESRYADNLTPTAITTHHTVWFKWVAPYTGSFIFNSTGSSFDTVLTLYTSSANPASAISDLTAVASNDDTGGGGTSRIVGYAATAGVTYYLQLLGFNASNFGAYVLNYPPPGERLFTTQTPSSNNNSDGTPGITTATSIRFASAGIVPAMRWYCTASTGGTWIGELWEITASDNGNAGTGTLLATKTLSGTPIGDTWNVLFFDTPVSVTTGKIYRVGIYSGDGRYVATSTFFNGTPLVNGNLTADEDNASSPPGLTGTLYQGSFAINATPGTYPNNHFNGTSYFVDALFDVSTGASAPAEATAVAVAAYDATVQTPTNAPAGQSAVAVAAFDATVAIGASGAVLQLDASSPGTSTANAQTVQTASFTPPAGSMLYAITLMAAASATANRTITITDTVGLTWTLVASSPLGPTPAPAGSVAAVYSAPVISSAAMRVTTAITSNGLNGILLKVFCYTGADQATPIDQAVAGHSAGAVVSQAITTTVPGTIPYLANIDAGGQAAPTTAAGTGTFTTAKPNVDQMWIARGSPMVVATPSTVTLASSAPTAGTVNDWVMFGIRAVLINQAPVSATAFDATVSTSSAVNASAGQAAVAADALAPTAANGNVTQDAAVTAAAQVASVANGNSTEQAAVTASALDAGTANGNLTADAAVAVAGFDATVSTSSSANAAAEQTAVTVAGFDATVATSGSANALADYAPVTTTALSPYVDATTLSALATAAADAYLATAANGNLTDIGSVAVAAFDATTLLAAGPPADLAAVTAAAFDATVGTATATNAPAGLSAVTASALDARVALGAGAITALVDVAAQQPPPPGVTSSPNRVLTTTSRENSITTITTQRLIITQ